MKIKKLLVLLLIPLVFCSCRENAQIDEMSFVKVIGIDSVSSGLRVTVGIPFPSKNDEAQNKKVESRTVQCRTLSEGMELLEASYDKKLFFGQVSAVIFGEDFARNGINDVIDFLVRSPEMRFDLPVSVVKDGTAEEIIAGNTDTVISEKIEGLLDSVKATSVSGNIKLSKLVEMLEDPFREIYLPYMTYDDVTNPEFAGYCIFNGERMNQFLTPEHSLGVSFLNNSVTNHTYVQELNGESVTLKITNSKTGIKLENGIFNIRITAKAEVLQAGDSVESFNDQTVTELCRMLDKEISETVDGTLNVLTQNKCDATPLGDCFEQSNPKAAEYGEWSEMLPRIKYTVNADTKLDISKTVQRSVKQKGNR